MKKRVILSSLILSLVFLLSSCGIPNWFYISPSDAKISNSTASSNQYSTVNISSDYALDVDVFILYTIHNASSSTVPSINQISSGLRSAFTASYKENDADAYPLRSGNNSIAEYTYTSTQQQFNLYLLRATGNSVSSSSGNAPIFKLSKREGGAMISCRIDYELVEENGAKYLRAVLTDSDGRTETMTLVRFNNTDFSVNMSNDSEKDHTSIESDAYNLYIWPIMYISSTSTANGHAFNNLMLVTASSFLSFDL